MRLILLLAIVPAALQAGEVAITLPPETGVYKAGAGAEVATANCLTCHSTEYVATQPPMPRAFWEGIVKKMKAKFGAPITDEQVNPIVDYLATNYGAPEKK